MTDDYKQENELNRLRAIVDICLRYISGEGTSDDDYALLANDYGGTGYEKDELCEKVHYLVSENIELRKELQKLGY